MQRLVLLKKIFGTRIWQKKINIVKLNSRIFHIILVKYSSQMGHLTLFERIRVIKLYNNLEVGCKYKYKVISALAKSNYGIEISDKGAYGIVKKWQSTQRLKR